VIVTTILDPEEASVDDLLALYRDRQVLSRRPASAKERHHGPGARRAKQAAPMPPMQPDAAAGP